MTKTLLIILTNRFIDLNSEHDLIGAGINLAEFLRRADFYTRWVNVYANNPRLFIDTPPALSLAIFLEQPEIYVQCRLFGVDAPIAPVTLKRDDTLDTEALLPTHLTVQLVGHCYMQRFHHYNSASKHKHRHYKWRKARAC